ncbi:DUF3466 family protein [Aliivibrio fischeri]|uniref:DUF3466 family protein n=1 Tax=Aliivibrio fischeri TaxID=668 RepID=UPI0012D9D5EA|nr:DUF3466 family protein [Aliivibrio fischeri]MUH94954.1 DUF3466 family protein [Aliivibrio fischeri]MUI65358.1 DUF3466 family protein [Aliivibrio fischeri]
MSSKLQLTTLAVLVSAALPAQAALYKVVEVAPGVSGNEVYGTAIQPGATTDPKGCFVDDCADGASYKLAGETRNRPDGFSYREEVPFAMDNSFGYIEDDYDGFEDYCFYQLGYATCEYWASDRWSSWYNETYSSNTPNSLAFIEGTAVLPTDAKNTVINSLDSSGSAIGNYSTATVRNTPINGDITGWKQGRQWATNGTYSVGSVSSRTGAGGERYYYFSKPAVWNGTTLNAVKWAYNDQQDGDYYAQGSMRDLYVDGTTFYGVGYNNYKDQHMNATIFKGTTTDLTNLSSVQINNAQVDISGDNIHSNSVATNINKNLVVVGQAKRSGGYPKNGAASNRLFIVPDASASSINASFFYGGIFFDGAGGEMGGINNFNEIVGRIDSENHREYDGKQRRQRAFIYPYGMTPKTDSSEETAITARRAIFKNKAWLLDDLTNGGSESSNNNQYRIYDASDINDAGVISATAVKCSGGYDSTSHNAYCGDGNGTEKVVAVKLVPIAGADASAIQPRSYDSTATERQGAGLGFGTLTILGLFGFMRKRIK